MRKVNAAGYCDGRPHATLRMEAKDQGIVLERGGGPDGCDDICVREPIINKEDDVYHLFYDGAALKGTHPPGPSISDYLWRICLVTSTDLVTWEKKGPLLEPGQSGDRDAGSAVSPWVIRQDGEWHMFYVGAQSSGFPYLTCKARSPHLAGPWTKQKDVVPFDIQPGTYYSETASPGHVVKHGDKYMMFFSSTTRKPGQQWVQRTVGIARTKDLNGKWTVDPEPIVPVEEQIENTSLYYEPANGLWYLFTNHIGLEPDVPTEYTDAVWVYWTQDPNKWDPKNKAVVLDGHNCTWSKKNIGMPTVIPVGNRLALFYDARGDSIISHLHRNIGLAWLDLPLSVPQD